MTDLSALVVALAGFIALCSLPFLLDRLASWRHRRAAARRNRLEARGPTRRRR